MYYEQIEELINNLAKSAKRLGFTNIDADDIIFDDSRAWSLYIPSSLKHQWNARKFGAYRNYLGGGICGGIQHNGDTHDGTYELGCLFAHTLAEIERLYNQGYEDSPSWEQPTGVLL